MRLARFLGYRLLLAIPVVLGIVVLNFFLIHLAPGDAASVLAGESGAASPEYMEQLRHKFGLDRPLATQFGVYLLNMLHLDLGYSFRNDSPVGSLIVDRLWPTGLLMLTAFAAALLIGTLLGLVAATGRNSWRDAVISLVSLVAYATPGFWLGLMMIVVFAIRLGWLPTSGYDTVGADNEGWDEVWDVGRHLVMPAVALALFYLAVYARVMRASVLEQIGMDYVTTARAKGQTEARVMVGHVLRNALLPVVTMAGVQAGNLIGGSIVVETVFGWPGVGTLAFNALQSRDLNLLLGIFFVSACLVVVINLAVDLVYVCLDPRMEL
ncbi:peptide/nickel transport system permease protein [Methylobacterium sp. PvP062]|uniref:Peptide/nickel transport system permease protein n=1 Tax=Methylobacterium radiotolerans TaxID=31998 RepID=A0ABV2N8X5_9HYPH|nr:MULTISPECIES: ABC transporter permease [Methylobacterium]MBN6821861.1 ABC transporter permease [Methylobacterium organophilum]MCX7336197.1 ABC transporter permease [Hyphomicrobiales bacterium]GAN50747.1 binding-protein-dependent transport system inner membrane protein [Methylobacterium sp. ME121]MBP2493823.1 peptide/nickel transport system permease protein [Methylobacterium sp. PvP105]MBP2499804.1 peptide/nickel transport system permease protein [Methylobacterium sp. PvP109]